MFRFRSATTAYTVTRLRTFYQDGRAYIAEYNRFGRPYISAADLKAGEIIAVSSTKTANPNRIAAIKLLAGVEPFIRAAQATSSGQRGQRAQSLDIPGLDGFAIP